MVRPNVTSQRTPAPAPVYADPASWIIKPSASRDSNGGIVVSASTNIPNGVKLWVQLATGETSKVMVAAGKFSSEAFTHKGQIIQDGGPHQVTFTAYFNGAWGQPAAVLKLTGEDGTNLHGPLFHKTDPDVTDSPEILLYKTAVEFPTITRELEAIAFVQSAVLTVDGRRSSASVGETVKSFVTPSTGIRMGKGWSATGISADSYKVQLDVIDASNDAPAVWQVDLHTRKVKYVNMSAKYMSYLPPD